MSEEKKLNKREIRPFLRWVGGKKRSIHYLEDNLPPNFSNENKYYEPFLGAGSLFFHLTPLKAILSDSNRNLIECYQAIEKRPNFISKYLQEHLSKTCRKYYYAMREKYNISKPSIARAALFIYLNKTCFNGIWRVNKKGKFNVPYGYREPPSLPSRDDLLCLSEALSGAKIFHKDYKKAVEYADEGDFVYFDPPYPPLNGTSYFTHYTKDGFNMKNHAELATLANILNERGCNVMISNADIPYIRNLYEDVFNIYELEVTRWIRADGNRYKVREVIITNYDVRRDMK